MLEQLAEESGAAVWLMVEEGGKAVYLAQEFGEQAIETHERLGKHEYMHCLAAGKAMLAFSRRSIFRASSTAMVSYRERRRRLRRGKR